MILHQVGTVPFYQMSPGKVYQRPEQLARLRIDQGLTNSSLAFKVSRSMVHNAKYEWTLNFS